jgi:hypothetical protein
LEVSNVGCLFDNKNIREMKETKNKNKNFVSPTVNLKFLTTYRDHQMYVPVHFNSFFFLIFFLLLYPFDLSLTFFKRDDTTQFTFDPKPKKKNFARANKLEE